MLRRISERGAPRIGAFVEEETIWTSSEAFRVVPAFKRVESIDKAEGGGPVTKEAAERRAREPNTKSERRPAWLPVGARVRERKDIEREIRERR